MPQAGVPFRQTQGRREMSEQPPGCLELGCAHWLLLAISMVLMFVGMGKSGTPETPRSALLVIQFPMFMLYTFYRMYGQYRAAGEWQRTEEQRDRRRALDLVKEHLGALRVKRMQKRIRDDYGNTVADAWDKEMRYFWRNVVQPACTSFLHYEWLKQAIDEAIDRHEAVNPLNEAHVDALEPLQYEAYCAGILNDNGWKASVTKGSGDQGIDVVATRTDIKAVFQCKKYSSPVGNKAVQEVIAGKEYASADYAFVVSNAQYTPAARELAGKAGVFLIHHSELENLGKYLDFGDGR